MKNLFLLPTKHTPWARCVSIWSSAVLLMFLLAAIQYHQLAPLLDLTATSIKSKTFIATANTTVTVTTANADPATAKDPPSIFVSANTATISVKNHDNEICNNPLLKNENPSTPGQEYHVVLSTPRCGDGSLGNGLSNIFIGALRSIQRNATFEFQCPGGPIGEFFSPKDEEQNTAWSMTLPPNSPDFCESCKSWPHTCHHGLQYGIPLIRQVLHRYFPEPEEADDLSIHFRCGDILKYKHHDEYGYPAYSTYQEYLEPFSGNLTSIGIVTGSFDSKLARDKDVPFLKTCQRLVEDLRDYLQDTFLSVKVNIRNYDATPGHAMGRLVHSKKIMWCNPSTFCLYPALATKAQSFILKSSGLYPFVERISEVSHSSIDTDNIHVVNEDFLSMKQIVTQRMSVDDIVEWLRKEPATAKVNNINQQEHAWKTEPAKTNSTKQSRLRPPAMDLQQVKHFEIEDGQMLKSKVYRVGEGFTQYTHVENVAITANFIHVYAPTQEMKALIKNSEQPTLAQYRRFDQGEIKHDLPTPKWVIHDEPMNVNKDCPRGYREEVAFVLSPWHTDNMFHLHNDNILPLVHNIQHAPWCNASTLQCDVPTTLYQLAGDAQRLKREVTFADVLRQHMFDQGVKDASELLGRDDSNPVCIKALVWGRGPYMLWRPTSDIYDIVPSLNRRVRERLQLPQQEQRQIGSPLKVVHIIRSPPRYIADAAPLMKACREAGFQCEECCNWKEDTLRDAMDQIGDADVIMGRHGAGLAHALYAAPGVTVIDFGAPSTWRKPFHNMAFLNGNGTLFRVPNVPIEKDAAFVSESFARDVFEKLKQGNYADAPAKPLWD